MGGLWRDVLKDPVTDHGKRSKAGRLALTTEGGKYKTVRRENAHEGDILVTVFENGILFVDDKLSDIREQARIRPA